MQHATALFTPEQLDAELAALRARPLHGSPFTIHRPDGTRMPGVWVNHLAVYAVAAKESARLGKPVTVLDHRGRVDQVVDMALTTTRARAALDELIEIGGHANAPEIVERLRAAIAADSWVEMVDETADARITLGYFCSRRGCMHELDGPEPGGYCSQECHDREEGS